MQKKPLFSIIIPLYVSTPYFFEAVEKCLKLDYPNFEILIGVDKKAKISFNDKRIKVLKTRLKRTGPAEKRDICILASDGEYIAFLDDDSYPDLHWLKYSLKLIKREKVNAVCGPGLTPPNDNFWQKVTGAVLASRFGSGPYYYRFVEAGTRYVDDYPAYNMIIKKDVLLKVGGFGTKFYGGEDTALCLKLIDAGEKIYYSPKIKVYHHRRRFPFQYMKQVGNVGLHRGYFVKAYPKTSLRLSYFAPALSIVAVIVLALVSIFELHALLLLFLVGLVSYLLVFIESLAKSGFLLSLFVPIAVAISHFSYGIQFLKGFFFTREMIR